MTTTNDPTTDPTTNEALEALEAIRADIREAMDVPGEEGERHDVPCPDCGEYAYTVVYGVGIEPLSGQVEHGWWCDTALYGATLAEVYEAGAAAGLVCERCLGVSS